MLFIGLKNNFLKSEYLYAMQTMTRQETIADYLTWAEGILSIYRGKDIWRIYPQLHHDLHAALEFYTNTGVDPMELKQINLEIVQKVYDESPV